MVDFNKILKIVKNRDKNAHSIIGIRPIEGYEYYIDYASIEFYQNYSPKFSYDSLRLNLKEEIRDFKINEVLKSKRETDFDVEELIYTPEQLKRIKELRKDVDNRVNNWDYILSLKEEYSKTFQVGDKIYYKGQKGIITFKHEERGYIQRWTVKVNNNEHRYVYGTSLLKRVEPDLSHIPIDKELDKLSTEKLLKMHRRWLKVNKGRANLKIKRILNEREHIKI